MKPSDTKVFWGPRGSLWPRVLPGSVGWVIFLLLGGGPATALTCLHPAGPVAIAPYGDANGSGTVNVADVACLVLASLATLHNQPLSSVTCLASAQRGDISCSGAIDVIDVTTCVHLVLTGQVPSGLLPDAQGCPSACTPCGLLVEGSCLIAGNCVAEGDRAGADGCQICLPASNPWGHSTQTCQHWYRDEDGDSFGQSTDFECRCVASAAYSAVSGGDCDDADDTVYPGATELCNGVDDDCDGETDEGFPGVGQACDGPDSDLCENGVLVCTPDGLGLECGPESPANLQEWCYNGIDDDCDGQVDEGCVGEPAPPPSSVSDLRLWFRADSLALNDDTPVTFWPDESGNDFHLNMILGAAPRLRTNAINGRPAVRFEGDSRIRREGFSLQDGASDFTVFMVIQAHGTQSDNACVYDNTAQSVGAGPGFMQDGSATNQYHTKWWSSSSLSSTTTSVAASTTVFQLHGTRKAGANIRHFVGGAQVANNTLSPSSLGNMASPERPFNLGGCSTAGRDWRGDIAEFIFYSRALSDAERQVVQFYLHQKYEFTGTILSLRSCADLAALQPSGVYLLDPALDGSPFLAYCDQTDGGGWTKILQYASGAYAPTANAAGNIAEAGITGFAKLSDAQINELRTLSAQTTYRMHGTDPGNSGLRTYLRSSQTFADTSRGWGIAIGTVQSCTAGNFGACSFSNISGATYFDTLVWGTAANDCGRYFSDYSHDVHCYAGPGAGYFVRCVNAGSTCNSHAQRTNFSISLKP